MEDRRDEYYDDVLDRATEALRRVPVSEGPPPEAVARVLDAVIAVDVMPLTILERIKKMKRIGRIAVAATILVALGVLVFWMTVGGGSASIAFANVAEALDSLRSATYDVTSESKGEDGQPPATATGKGFFLAPSHQRIEISVDSAYSPAVKAAAAAARRTHPTDRQAAEAAAKTAAETMSKAVALMPKMTFVTIADGQAGKCMMLMPMTKSAVTMDMKKMREDMKKSGNPAPPDQFEMVRRLVRQRSGGTGEKAERLGKKEIDGREAVGFRTHANGMDMTLWADPETAWPIRIEISMDMMAGVYMVMNNFRYNIDLDPSLFSLEPPEGYATVAMEKTMPVEEHLLRTLRTIAEHNKDMFPAKLGINKEIMELLNAEDEPEIGELMDKRTQDKMEAELNKVLAKYGGKEKLKAKYGKDIPPEIMAEIMKAGMEIMQEQIQKQTQQKMQKGMPLMQERMQGITFYTMLKPENDPHYAGGGVKLGTPDCPILWYKPSGADKYRVIYADLTVKELTPNEVKQLPEANPKPQPATSPAESHETD